MSDCGGTRLRREARDVRVGGADDRRGLRADREGRRRRSSSGSTLSEKDAVVAEKVLREIRRRLGFLTDVGLDYLTLDRLSSTLSGGESQRINLATSLGSALVDTLYVLDEPSIGLHPRDNERLIAILLQLRDQGNTVIVVEHDADMIRVADQVVDLGLGAGEQGGRIIYAGLVRGPAAGPAVAHGAVPARRAGDPGAGDAAAARTCSGCGLRRASEHNLKDIDVEIPLGLLTCVTGVSGSGKSTLVHDVHLRGRQAVRRATGIAASARTSRLDGAEFVTDAVLVDQQPIGRTPRSNPVTYLKAFDPIRELFAATKDARARGLTASHFSFNVPGGRCEACEGEGVVRVEMQFLADVFVPCDQCDGKRFRPQVLEVRFKGKNIDQVLDLTVREALAFFAGAVKVTRRLQVLDEIGLGYLRLGQPATTLSGGEAQRIKIASHLGIAERRARALRARRAHDRARTSTTSSSCSRRSGSCSQAGHSLLVIEHNLDVLKTADWIIDLGPEGGDAGGHLVAAGTPEQVATVRGVVHRPAPAGACLRPAGTTRTLIRHEASIRSPVPLLRSRRVLSWRSPQSPRRRPQWQDVIRNLRHPKPRRGSTRSSGSARPAMSRPSSRSRRSFDDPDDRVQAAAIDAELTFFLTERISGRRILGVGGSKSRAQHAFDAGPLRSDRRRPRRPLIDALIAAMRDENPRVRFDAVHALGFIAEPPLPPDAGARAGRRARSLRSDHPRRDGARARPAARARGRRQARRRHRRFDQLVRQFAVEALGLVREDRALPRRCAISIARAGDRNVRWALLALARIGAPDDLAHFRDASDRPQRRRPARRRRRHSGGSATASPSTRSTSLQDRRSRAGRAAGRGVCAAAARPRQTHVIASHARRRRARRPGARLPVRARPARVPGIQSALKVADRVAASRGSHPGRRLSRRVAISPWSSRCSPTATNASCVRRMRQ